MAIQEELSTAWQTLLPSFPTSNIHVLPSIQDAVQVVRSLSAPNVEVLACGSLHLVGGVIEVADLGGVALWLKHTLAILDYHVDTCIHLYSLCIVALLRHVLQQWQ